VAFRGDGSLRHHGAAQQQQDECLHVGLF
jgi:hypothetical protein